MLRSTIFHYRTVFSWASCARCIDRFVDRLGRLCIACRRQRFSVGSVEEFECRLLHIVTAHLVGVDRLNDRVTTAHVSSLNVYMLSA